MILERSSTLWSASHEPAHVACVDDLSELSGRLIEVLDVLPSTNDEQYLGVRENSRVDTAICFSFLLGCEPVEDGLQQFVTASAHVIVQRNASRPPPSVHLSNATLFGLNDLIGRHELLADEFPDDPALNLGLIRCETGSGPRDDAPRVSWLSDSPLQLGDTVLLHSKNLADVSHAAAEAGGNCLVVEVLVMQFDDLVR